MPQQITFSIKALRMSLDHDLLYTKVVRWRELEMLEARVPRTNEALAARAKKLVVSGFERFLSEITSIDPIEFSLRQLPDSVEHKRVSIDFAPPRHNPFWQTPIRVTFDVVFWPAQDFWIAAVPILDIELQLRSLERFDEIVETRIRKCLSLRFGKKFSLEPILFLQQIRSAKLHCVTVKAEMPTMMENVKRENGQAAQSEIWQQWNQLGVVFAENVKKIPRAFECNEYLRRIRDAIALEHPLPILLIGRSGVGKTALWHEFVRKNCRANPESGKRVSHPLRDYRFGEADVTQLATASTDPDESCCGESWQSRCERFVQLASEQRVVLHLGNLWEMTQIGMSIGQNRSLGAQLISSAAGRFVFFCECTPEQLTVLEQEHPGLLFPFHKIEIDEPGETASQKIYRNVAESRYPGVFEEEALQKIDALHRRYATYSASPGRPLTFLHNLARERITNFLRSHALENSEWEHSMKSASKTLASEGLRITKHDVVEAFSHETGLPRILLDDSQAMDPEATKAWFRKRIIGQDDSVAEINETKRHREKDAISILVDTLLSYKARLTRVDRPIASLLFVGPSGVGKTETAKALAEFLYNDPRRMIRIDMSEYAEYGAAERLIRGSARGEGLLTMKVRQQPFSVVLLDEFEKAHAEVFDLLLQVLGEGRLTDAAGRVAYFRNCVILMTSNIGVERFGKARPHFEQSGSGTGESSAALAHFTTEIARLLRPEMLNRIDRIVPFRPLSKESLRKILDIQLRKISQRFGLARRALDLTLEPEAAEHLVENSYDPRFGARPLKRFLERELLVPLAKSLAEYAPETALQSRFFLRNGKIAVQLNVQKSDREQEKRKTYRSGRIMQLGILRRKIRKLGEHACFEEMRGRVHRVNAIRRKIERKRLKNRHLQLTGELRLTEDQKKALARVEKIDEPFLNRLDELNRKMICLEELTLLEHYRDSLHEKPQFENGDESCELTHHELETEFKELVRDLYIQENETVDHVLLILYAKTRELLGKAVSLYERCAALFHFETVRYSLLLCTKPQHLNETEEGDTLLFHSQDEALLESYRSGKSTPGAANWRYFTDKMQIVSATKIDEKSPRNTPGRSQVATLLEISGKRAAEIFAEEFGKHRFQNLGANHITLECSIEVSTEPLERYFPQIDTFGNVQIADPCIRRTIECSPEQVRPGSTAMPYDAARLKAILEQQSNQRIDDWLEE